jgi:hypothetical protein
MQKKSLVQLRLTNKRRQQRWRNRHASKTRGAGSKVRAIGQNQ